jgi:hypothetical protein
MQYVPVRVIRRRRRRWSADLQQEGNDEMATPQLILIGADKGGVGKTTVARALLDYLAVRALSFRSFDTEPSAKGVLKRFRPEAEQVDIATVPGQMQVIDGLGDVTTVVDLRAGMLTPTLRALAATKVIDDVRAGTLDLLCLHVVGPTVASGAEIAETLAALHGARHVIVECYASPDARFPDLGTALPVISIPNLNETACEAVDRSGMSFETFSRDQAQSRTLRGYVRTWLDAVWSEFDKIKLLG